MTGSRFLSGLLVGFLAAAAPAGAQDEGSASSSSACVQCHLELEDSVSAEAWKSDVHRVAGLGCEGCHGGDPSLALAEDPEASMSPAKGFSASPDRLAIPQFCGNCHADAVFMKQFNPQARVDQLAEYRTSVHGKRNADGDPTPATCIDCHGAHGILPVALPNSPVYAVNVPETCARCHADTAMMEPYGISSDQYDEYRDSVHAVALLERGDTAAPACNDCHGNHGAAPPGVASVANVCGQCHAREASLFRSSFKAEVFEALEVSECIVCHDNHRILHPTPERFRSGTAPAVSRGRITSSDPLSADMGSLEPGESARMTWVVSIDPHLEEGDDRLAHRLSISAEGFPPVALEASMEPGFADSEIEQRQATSEWLTATLIMRPTVGVPVEAGDSILYELEVAAADKRLDSVKVQDHPREGVNTVPGSMCLECHVVGDECDRVTREMYDALSATEREIREAETLLHRAEVMGMDVSETVFELSSSGKTASVEARALIHSFDLERLLERTRDAREVAASARQAGDAAMAELQVRRKGLAVSLVLVGLVLVGLFLKIREIEQRRRAARGIEETPTVS